MSVPKCYLANEGKFLSECYLVIAPDYEFRESRQSKNCISHLVDQRIVALKDIHQKTDDHPQRNGEIAEKIAMIYNLS